MINHQFYAHSTKLTSPHGYGRLITSSYGGDGGPYYLTDSSSRPFPTLGHAAEHAERMVTLAEACDGDLHSEQRCLLTVADALQVSA